MKTRIAAVIVLLCAVGFSSSARAAAELPTMSSGTIEPYLSFMAGVAIPFSEDATFTDGSQPRVERDVDYQMKQSVGGNAGIWFPTRNKLAGFDLGAEIEGYVWWPDIACCRENVNARIESYGFEGTTTEIQGIYIGGNVMIRRPFAISEAYPNGRWHPYIGVGGGAHQLAFRPGGARGATSSAPLTTQRDTAPAFQVKGGVKVFLIKYVAAFAEAKYTHAFHDALGTDRFGQSGIPFDGPLVLNDYESTIRTISVHAGLSLHFDIRP
jgi:opacity protein-like surface antigen